MNVSARIPLEGNPRNLILGTFMKIFWENPNSVKIGKTFRAFHVKYISASLFTPATLNLQTIASFGRNWCQAYRICWKGINITRTPRNITFYINCLSYLPSFGRKWCQTYTIYWKGINIKRTPYNITFYILCLSYLQRFLYWNSLIK